MELKSCSLEYDLECKRNKKFRQFIEQFPGKHHETVDFLYTTPLHRLPRYKLLFNQLASMGEFSDMHSFDCLFRTLGIH